MFTGSNCCANGLDFKVTYAHLALVVFKISVCQKKVRYLKQRIYRMYMERKGATAHPQSFRMSGERFDLDFEWRGPAWRYYATLNRLMPGGLGKRPGDIIDYDFPG